MKVILIPGVLKQIQNELKMTDQEFAEYLGVSRSQLWRVQLPANHKNFSLGEEFIAKILNRFSQKMFEDFFLVTVSQECDSVTA
ncbi:hypothetical protein HQN90_17645 [Paenibacillus alba]|uniref:hypothetical protein n=1 Tax=Paenibacillus alba TaxID=1197127 RepID=UPI0015659F0B|nr:hypothetical protein [Paenibacillus alba]NQX67948.1 hypothetical protein [Paenibacillus alba]